jgi:hypothetical protein
MQIIINECGALKILRRSKFKFQYCMHQPETYCGDWCPLFGDIVEGISNTQTLKICKVRLSGTIEDQRVSNKTIDEIC